MVVPEVRFLQLMNSDVPTHQRGKKEGSHSGKTSYRGNQIEGGGHAVKRRRVKEPSFLSISIALAASSMMMKRNKRRPQGKRLQVSHHKKRGKKEVKNLRLSRH